VYHSFYLIYSVRNGAVAGLSAYSVNQNSIGAISTKATGGRPVDAKEAGSSDYIRSRFSSDYADESVPGYESSYNQVFCRVVSLNHKLINL